MLTMNDLCTMMRLSALNHWYVWKLYIIEYVRLMEFKLQEGEIWPNSQAEVSIVFTPDEPIRYACNNAVLYYPLCGVFLTATIGQCSVT